MGLFKRTFQAADQGGDDTTEKDLFSHSNSFETILADEARRKRESLDKAERRKERKNAKQMVKAEKGARKDEMVKAEPSTNGESPKRRRITTEEGLKLLSRIGMHPDTPLELDDEEEATFETDETYPVRKSPRCNRIASEIDPPQIAIRPMSGVPAVQNMGEDEVVKITDLHSVSDNLTASQASEDAEEYESDPDIAMLRRVAREKRKKQKLAASTTETSVSGAEQLDPPSLANEPSIQYFIESPIEGTKPLLVHRKLSQRLLELREAWVKRQDIPQWQKDKIFFINKMRKLYDMTTGVDLGLSVDGLGNIVRDGSEHMEGAERVHLVAVTDELFAQMKKDQAGRERRSLMLSSQPDEEQSTQQAPKEREFRVQLRAKGQQEQRFKVRLSTSISKLEWVARDKFRADKGSTVWLEFDGERLDTDSTVENTEIATCDEGDTIIIDVYIR